MMYSVISDSLFEKMHVKIGVNLKSRRVVHLCSLYNLYLTFSAFPCRRLRNISRGGSQALPSRAPGQAESAAAAPAPAAPTTQHAEDIKKKRRSLLAEQWEQKFQ